MKNKNNKWLSTIIYYRTISETHNISKWNSQVLPEQNLMLNPVIHNSNIQQHN